MSQAPPSLGFKAQSIPPGRGDRHVSCFNRFALPSRSGEDKWEATQPAHSGDRVET